MKFEITMRAQPVGPEDLPQRLREEYPDEDLEIVRDEVAGVWVRIVREKDTLDAAAEVRSLMVGYEFAADNVGFVPVEVKAACKQLQSGDNGAGTKADG